MIEHQKEQQRFVLSKDGNECLLEYETNGNSVNFTHTYVPFALRGQGLAKVIVEEGLAWAKDEGLQVEASCSYVQKFL